MNSRRVEKLTDCPPTELRDYGTGYIRAFVTFLDILAFKQLVASNSPKEVNARLDGMVQMSQLAQRRRAVYASEDLLPMVMQISDSIIRIQPVPDREGIEPFDLLVGEIRALLLIQGNLVCNGVLVRGGLTFGEVCVRPSRVFGPAFIRAYEIESKLARYPRILVDENLCRIDNSHPFSQKANGQTMRTAHEVLGELLERNDDGQFAIQYLTHLCEADRPNNISITDVLKAHRDCIVALLADPGTKKQEEALAKIRWLANYHNRWIDGYKKLDEAEFEATGRGLFIDINDY